MRKQWLCSLVSISSMSLQSGKKLHPSTFFPASLTFPQRAQQHTLATASPLWCHKVLKAQAIDIGISRSLCLPPARRVPNRGLTQLFFKDLEVPLDNWPCIAASLEQLSVLGPNNVSIETGQTKTEVTVSTSLCPLQLIGCGHVLRVVSVHWWRWAPCWGRNSERLSVQSNNRDKNTCIWVSPMGSLWFTYRVRWN